MAQPRAALDLLSVLDQLPRDDLWRSIWTHLSTFTCNSSDSSPGNHLGRPFRLVSRHSRRLADQLTRRLSLTLPRGDDREVTLSSQAAFLGRQEGLEHLILDGGGVASAHKPANDVELFILKTVLQGCGTLRHLHTLDLNAPSGLACSAAAGTAIQLCCPSLRELLLHVPSPGAAFFTPLRSCHGLCKVSTHVGLLDGKVIEALAALPSLRELSLRGQLQVADAALLTGLTGLHQLNVQDIACGGAPADLALALGGALGRLTQLTALDAPRWRGADRHAIDGLVAQLGGLRQLVALSFSGLDMDDEVSPDAFAALCRLTALTRLSCPRLSAQIPPTGGHLPQLQRLQILSLPGSAAMAATVRRLLPLPELREFRSRVWFTKDEGNDTWMGPSSDAGGAQAAAAWQAASALATAPKLTAVHLTFLGDMGDNRPLQPAVEASQAAGILSALVLPLRDTLTHLNLKCLRLGTYVALWPTLCLAHRLDSLSLEESSLPAFRLLMGVGQCMGSLRHLSVLDCEGVSGSTAVALAGMRTQPLRITWAPALDAEECRLFQAAARPGVTLDSQPLA